MQQNVIIKGFSYIKENYNTRPDQALHLPLRVRSDAFDVPVKSQTYDSEKEILTVEFEQPVRGMSHFLFIPELDGQRLWNSIESIILPDTLVYALDDKRVNRFAVRDSSITTSPVIKGKYSIGDTFWAPEGKVIFWSDNKNTTSALAQAQGVKSLPDYFGFQVDDKLVIPEGVETLGEHCFDGCGGIKQVKLPKTLKKLPKYAFSDCRWLRKINLTHIEEIGEFALSETVLKTVKLGRKLRFIGEGAFTLPVRLRQPIFEGCEKFIIEDGRGIINENVLVLCPPSDYPDNGRCLHEFDIPTGVTRLGDNSCRLAPFRLKFPSTLKEIGDNVFGQYKVCSVVEFPESVEIIGINTFTSNPYLKELTIPSKVKVIPLKMVSGCDNLRCVRIMGESVEILHHSFFTWKTDAGRRPRTSKFEKLEIHSLLPPMLIIDEAYASEKIDFLANGIIEVPQQSVDLYRQATGWNRYADNIKAGKF